MGYLDVINLIETDTEARLLHRNTLARARGQEFKYQYGT